MDTVFLADITAVSQYDREKELLCKRLLQLAHDSSVAPSECTVPIPQEWEHKLRLVVSKVYIGPEFHVDPKRVMEITHRGCELHAHSAPGTALVFLRKGTGAPQYIVVDENVGAPFRRLKKELEQLKANQALHPDASRASALSAGERRR